MLRAQIESNLAKLKKLKNKDDLSITHSNETVEGGKTARQYVKKHIKEVKTILSAKVAPKTYVSAITTKTHDRSPEETLLC